MYERWWEMQVGRASEAFDLSHSRALVPEPRDLCFERASLAVFTSVPFHCSFWSSYASWYHYVHRMVVHGNTPERTGRDEQATVIKRCGLGHDGQRVGAIHVGLLLKAKHEEDREHNCE